MYKKFKSEEEFGRKWDFRHKENEEPKKYLVDF
jgi:hypothetical protein